MTAKKPKSAEEVAKTLTEVEDNVNSPITVLPGIGEVRAKRLIENGVETIMDLAVTTPMEIKDITGVDEDVAINLVSLAKDKLTELDIIRKSEMTGTELYNYRTRDIDRIHTGSHKLDDMFGGGIETESITEFFGIFGSGKTQVCHTCAVMVQLPKDKGGLNGNVVWVDTENTFRPERIVGIAMALTKCSEEEAKKFLERITVIRAHNSAHQLSIVNNMNHWLTMDLRDKKKEDPKPRLLIVDSLTSLFRTEYLGRGNLANRQQKLGQHMKKLARIAEVWKMAVLITNQVLSDPSAPAFMDPIKPAGGNVVGHISTYRLYIKRAGKKRIVRMVDSPSHPDFEVVVDVGEEGIKDAKD
jgi:DNA repair protein RadA